MGETRKFFTARPAGAQGNTARRETIEGVAGDSAEVARALEDGKFIHVVGRIDGVAQAEARPAEALTYLVGEFEFGGIKLVWVKIEDAGVKDNFFGFAVFDKVDAYTIFKEKAGWQQIKAELGVGIHGADRIGIASETDAPVLIVSQVGKNAAEFELIRFVGAFGAFLCEGDDAAKTVDIGFSLLGGVLS